jgi:transglutaminase-like putative cysteine protease
MNSDLLLLSFSILSWGWLSQTWLAASGLLFAVAAAKYSVWRWQLSSNQFYRCGDLSALLAMLLLVDVYILQPTERPIFVLLKWLPLLFSPALFAQLFSSSQKLPLAALFYSLRKQQAGQAEFKLPHTALYNRESTVIRLLREIDFVQPYAALTILSAGAANVQTPAYFIIAVILFVGILWPARAKHGSVPAWLLTVALAVIISHFGYRGLSQLNILAEQKVVAWLGRTHADPFKGLTSIGDIGRLKLSDKIEFRLRADGPKLLHQASYDLYFGHSWAVSNRLFTPDNPETRRENNSTLKQLEILQQFNREEVLALPDGTVKITGLDDAYLQYTELGAVKADLAPRFARYQVFYTGQRTGLPGKYDLQIPKQHADWLQRFSNELKLAGQRPEIVAERIKTYFRQHFFYSLYLGDETDADQALRDFMLKRKAGHCEYFAAATVFLLRHAGIPARLANGYAVDEYDGKQDLYIVRSRHAHAWALAYINGVWQPVDSTPSQWLALETEHAGLWQPVSDWWSNIMFNFRQWQLQQTPGQNAKLGLLVALLLSAYLVCRIYSAKTKPYRNIASTNNAEQSPVYPGLDSELYLIEQCLQNTAQSRQHNESIQQWAQRLQHPALIRLYKLHYRLRFDPRGISAEQRQQLQQQVNEWINDFRNNTAKH